MSDEIRNCLRCGKPFTVMKNGGGKKFCGKACQLEHNKAGATERWHKVYKERRRKERMAAEQEKKNRPESIAEIQRKARAAGLSYGQYMLQRQLGRI